LGGDNAEPIGVFDDKATGFFNRIIADWGAKLPIKLFFE